MKKWVAILFFCNCTVSFAQVNTINKSAINDSLYRLLTLCGNDDLGIITDIYSNDKALTDDSINSLLKISDKNYQKNKNTPDSSIDFQFRHIYLSDQILRIKCYVHQLVDYSVVQKNDSSLQVLFLSVTKNRKIDLRNMAYQMAFEMLLLNSTSNLLTGFFENNFCVLASGFSNNFKDYHVLKNLLDSYLKAKFNMQYFNTESGKGRRTNGTFGLLPVITEKEMKEVLANLKIVNAIY